MAKDVDLLGYLPPILHEIKEIIAIANAENKSLSQVWKLIEDTLNNQFVHTANENAVERYERMLGLVKASTEGLETRKFRILTKYQEQAPFTMSTVSRMLNTLVGEGQYKIIRDAASKSLTVKIQLTVKNQFDVAALMLERVTPQNMVLTVELLYNTHAILSGFTHAQLASFTHRELREELMN